MNTNRFMAGILPITIMMMTASCSSDNDNIQEPQSTGRTIYVEIPAENTTETRAALGESVSGKRYYAFADGDNLQISGTVNSTGKAFYSVVSIFDAKPAPFTLKSKSADGKSAVFSGYVHFEDGTSDMSSKFDEFEATLLPDRWETFGTSYYFYTIRKPVEENPGHVIVSHDPYCNWPCKTLDMAFSRYAWLTHTFTDGTLAANPINLTTCKNAFLDITINGAPEGKWYVNGFGDGDNNYCQGGFEDTDPVTTDVVDGKGVLHIAMAFPAGVKNIRIMMGVSGGKGTDRTLTLPAENTTEAGKIYNITRNYIDLEGGGKE